MRGTLFATIRVIFAGLLEVWMQRFWLAITICIISAPFIVAGEVTAPVNNPIGTPAQTNPQKITKMAATGKIVEITDTTIRIERTVKGNVEIMDLDLEKPVKDIKSGDKVRVSYIEKEGRHVVTKITKVTIKPKAPAIRKENKTAGGQSADAPKGK